MPRKFPKILKNRYIIVILSFFMYISFFDAHDLISQLRLRWKLHGIQEEMQYLEAASEESKHQINELTTNDASLEKFAREQYRMKRENEEIFVIVEENKE